MIEDEPVSITADRINISGLLTGDNNAPVGAVLFLHGGGKTNSKSIFRPWQKALAAVGFLTLAIDFRGCGDSSGEFTDGSLTHRLTDARAAVNFLRKVSRLPENRICIAGSSMGGHITARLTDTFPDVSSVILVCAAAYSGSSEPLRLDDSFTRAIRHPDSFADSPAFRSLSRFPGSILTIYGEHDRIIPGPVAARYESFGRSRGAAIRIPGAAHQLLQPKSPDDAKRMRDLIDGSIAFLRQLFPVRSG